MAKDQTYQHFCIASAAAPIGRRPALVNKLHSQ
jgi:hypothetical protein